MLVLSRKIGERIIIAEGIEISVVDIRGGKVRIGIEAPQSVRIHREEVREGVVADACQAADRGEDSFGFGLN
jgi:carbon storage regulator